MTKDNGDFITVIRLSRENFKLPALRVVAIDGSFHQVFLPGGKISYIVVASVRATINGEKFSVDAIDVKDEICECESPEEEMRRLEYDVANTYEYDLILMDRLFSMDREKGLKIPKNSIGIVKDFDILLRNELDKIQEAPWIAVKDEKIGYFKLLDQGYVFLINKEVQMSWDDILKVLVILGYEPIPEALGYNYLLYLADKAAKYYRDIASLTLDTIRSQNFIRYRDFRSFVERIRRNK
ncbi:MAG: DUF4230 domain-containing protein [Sulfolobaceae archaeon]|nr:DUF4230 domain-containing protein [Sulfolobaceae archaeon]